MRQDAGPATQERDLNLGKDIRRIIWLQTGFLGDIVLTTAAFRWVKENYPDVSQFLITTPLGSRALADHPHLDRTLVFDKRGRSLWAAARDLRRELGACSPNDTVLLQVHRSARSSLLAGMLPFSVVTYEETVLSSLACWRIPRVALLHETQRILQLLEPLGVARWDFRDAEVYLPAAERNAVTQRLKSWALGSPIIGIAPGSVWATKRWPQESYRQLAELLLENSNAKLLIIGSKDEREAAEAVASVGFDFPDRVLNLAGETSLDDLRGIFPELTLLVSNDSSPLHYASAFKIPSLAIFGATVPALGFGPLAPGSRIAELELSCRPCSDHGPQVCPLGHFRCMKDQNPLQISKMALAMLAAGARADNLAGL